MLSPFRTYTATAGESTLSGTLLQSSAPNLAGLDSLRAFTPPAQIALLQHLTAKGESAESRWLQASTYLGIILPNQCISASQQQQNHVCNMQHQH